MTRRSAIRPRANNASPSASFAFAHQAVAFVATLRDTLTFVLTADDPFRFPSSTHRGERVPRSARFLFSQIDYMLTPASQGCFLVRCIKIRPDE